MVSSFYFGEEMREGLVKAKHPIKERDYDSATPKIYFS